MPRTLLFWSSGKDSAWALQILREQMGIAVVGLVTSFNEEADRVAMHAVRRSLVEAQARAVGLPLWSIELPVPCSNADYEERTLTALGRAKEEGITHVAFGDLYLEDVREYRVAMLSKTDLEPLFPIWTSPDDTSQLAHDMLAAGLRSVITCVDPQQLAPEFAGREFSEGFLSEIPTTVDPCGERGEFHTFCYGGPMFDSDLEVQVGETVLRDRFWFTDVIPNSNQPMS